jgi:ABC-type Fe3+/spermidine/putrescine transport system ATPase subunit
VFTAIDNISLDIAPGNFFVIVGPSGCGKTTLLRILADLEQPSAGTITIRPEYADRPGNSMVFQGDSIFPWMTVRENADYGLKLRGVAAPEIERARDRDALLHATRQLMRIAFGEPGQAGLPFTALAMIGRLSHSK